MKKQKIKAWAIRRHDAGGSVPEISDDTDSYNFFAVFPTKKDAEYLRSFYQGYVVPVVIKFPGKRKRLADRSKMSTGTQVGTDPQSPL